MMSFSILKRWFTPLKNRTLLSYDTSTAIFTGASICRAAYPGVVVGEWTSAACSFGSTAAYQPLYRAR